MLKRSQVAGRLLQALALRQRPTQAALLITISICGDDKDMADVASCSFGPQEKGNCPDDADFLTNFSATFPLTQPHSRCLFCSSNRIVMHVIGKLLMQALPLDAWL